jgi:predicted membrane chloride channel (bestrophin family)
MNWGGIPGPRVVAGVYLLAFVALVVGVVLLLVTQLTGSIDSLLRGAAVVLFGVGVLGISTLAFWLGGRLPRPMSRFWEKRSGWQWVHHRLSLGLEIRSAWRVLVKSPGVPERGPRPGN